MSATVGEGGDMPAKVGEGDDRPATADDRRRWRRRWRLRCYGNEDGGCDDMFLGLIYGEGIMVIRNIPK